ncbi:hypothetical protein BKA07_001724 [Brevibacterium marinum]|uniref:Uncharacterized protein n=1 Tax=Brevibacterium marinum TaxID=418643 RepID=A0A846RSF6_9MICO|nr:hypothetical protein [Brevibacterium marinum]
MISRTEGHEDHGQGPLGEGPRRRSTSTNIRLGEVM